MEDKKISNVKLVSDIVQGVGISALDVFMHWVKTGEIKNIMVSIVYKNGDVLKADLLEQLLTLQGKKEVCAVLETEENISEAEDETLSCGAEESSTEEANQESDVEGVSLLPRETSFSRGTIVIKPAHTKNIGLGAYVYTTGDILWERNASSGVSIRGIILSHSKEQITIVKNIGSYKVSDALEKVQSGWRLLTLEECRKLVLNKAKFNVKLSELRRKQIDGSLLLLFRDEKEGPLCFQVSTQQVKKTLTGADALVDRETCVYLAKDLRIV